MGKNKNRREKQKQQALRALAKGNPDVVQTLAERNPEVAARHLAERLRAASEKQSDGALLALAERLTARLRREGKLSVARTLAEAGADRSARLRLERALCAFAMGDNAEVERAALADDPTASHVLDVLRQAASGVLPNELPPSFPGGVRALHAVASAAAHAIRGEVKRAVSCAGDVPGPLRLIFLADEMATAAALAEEPLTAEAAARAARMPSSTAWSYATVRSAFVAELLDKAPALALDIARRYGMGDQIEQRAMLQALREGGCEEASNENVSFDERRDVQGAIDFVRRFGAGAFSDAGRPTALLYEAFAWMQKDRRKAARSLENAIAKGADLVEALRARLVLALSNTGPVCRSCGYSHGHSAKPAAAAADSLARALRRDPSAAPLAAEASLFAAEEWLAIGEDRSAHASLREARTSARTLPAWSSRLDVSEALVIATSEPQRAHSLVEAAIAREPTSVAAWKARIILAHRAGDEERADDLVLEAAAATNDPALRREASEIRALRSEERSDAIESDDDALDVLAGELDLSAPQEALTSRMLKDLLAKVGVTARMMQALPEERYEAYVRELTALFAGNPKRAQGIENRGHAVLDRLLMEVLSAAAADGHLPTPGRPGMPARRKGAEMPPAIPIVSKELL